MNTETRYLFEGLSPDPMDLSDDVVNWSPEGPAGTLLLKAALADTRHPQRLRIQEQGRETVYDLLLPTPIPEVGWEYVAVAVTPSPSPSPDTAARPHPTAI